MLEQYLKEIRGLLDVIEIDEEQSLKKAAKAIAECIQNNGIVHVFGCGHSHMLGEELFYRAGGLAPINPILIEDLMLHKGAVRSSTLEKQNDFAEHFMQNVDIQANDVIIVASTSGRNPVPIDVAERSKAKGAFVITVTSPRYAETQASRHSSGKYLYNTADLVIDNHIEAGDALLKDPSMGTRFGSASSIAGLAIVNSVMVEAVEIMLKNNFDPPIFKSGNVDGAEDHNRKLVEKYKKRIPILEG
ncbi:SIS domain-containing protein [Bacillus sp. ISL-47]|uniref:SIS domain-containing protein n=1 Tax=Bacillus sp. ISL-47 TaxID=2819130 RepID=UPI001BE6F625|nr:SIS domain-containing protein [Bacillus sp. ISL-47]MBT2686674.1 SIS domain-containing protein [Bacillus sp. ISL-47]MBT2707066.1 SIS domain-containing protein [Pseudomonas sp. ISL-84]